MEYRDIQLEKYVRALLINKTLLLIYSSWSLIVNSNLERKNEKIFQETGA